MNPVEYIDCIFNVTFCGIACSIVVASISPLLGGAVASAAVGIFSGLAFFGIAIGLCALCNNTRLFERQELKSKKLETLFALHKNIINIIESDAGNKNNKLGQILYGDSSADQNGPFLRNLDLLTYLYENFTKGDNGEKTIDVEKIETFCRENKKSYEIIQFLAQVALNTIENKDYEFSCMVDQLLSFHDQEKLAVVASVPLFATRFLNESLRHC